MTGRLFQSRSVLPRAHRRGSRGAPQPVWLRRAENAAGRNAAGCRPGPRPGAPRDQHGPPDRRSSGVPARCVTQRRRSASSCSASLSSQSRPSSGCLSGWLGCGTSIKKTCFRTTPWALALSISTRCARFGFQAPGYVPPGLTLTPPTHPPTPTSACAHAHTSVRLGAMVRHPRGAVGIMFLLPMVSRMLDFCLQI